MKANKRMFFNVAAFCGRLLHKFLTGFRLCRLLFLAGIACIMPRNRKKIVFGAWFGKTYGCNPKAFFEYVLAHDRSYQCVWVGNEELRGKVLQIPGAKFARKGSLLAIWHCLTASCYVCNIIQNDDIGTVPYCGRVNIFNLGHGMANKCCGVRQFNGNGSRHWDSRISSVVIKLISWMYPASAWRSVASNFEGGILCREFVGRLAPDRILPFGYCRDDFLIDNKSNVRLKAEIKSRLASLMGIDSNKKWYLYAPTWRHALKDCFLFQHSKNRDKYNKLFEDNGIILIERHHPQIIERMHLKSDLSGNMYMMGADVSANIDVQELLLATDVLISDYSSIYFDFGLLDRPVIEFTYDYEFAKNEDFGFEYDLREYAPGPFAYTEDELLKLLAQSPEELMKGRKQKFLDYMEYEKGTACESLLKFIDEKVAKG